MLRLVNFLALAMVLLSLLACGGDPRSASLASPAGSLAMPGDYAARSGDFRLKVLDASYQYGGSASYSLRQSAGPAGTNVAVSASGHDLRASLLELHYDPAKVHPLAVHEGVWPGLDGEKPISLAIVAYPGVVYYGACLVNLDERAGVEGQFDVITVEFASGPQPGRLAAAAPQSQGSVVPDLAVDTATGDISFSYANQGDYDQNSEVNIADLTPLGVNFGETSGGGPFPFAQAESQVDGDSNGEINIADLTPIGSNFLNSAAEFHLYTGAQADYPSAPDEDNGAAALGLTVQQSAGQGNPGLVRLTYSANEPSLIGTTAEAAWLRPSDGGSEGVAGTIVLLGSAGDTTPPVWTNDPDAVGVIAVIPRDGEAEVVWGEATDAVSAPVTYQVYYQEGSSIDYGTASVVEVPAPADPGGASTTIGGLSNGTEYCFAVRASDSAPTPNQEQNANSLTSTPAAAADLPAAQSTDAAYATPMQCPGTCDVSAGPALDFASDLVIDGTLNVGDGGATFNVEGNLIVNGTINFDITDADLPGGEEDLDNLVFIVKGDVTFGPTAVVYSEGNFSILNDPADNVTPLETEADTETDQNPELYPFNFMPDDGSGALGHLASTLTPLRAVSSHEVYYGPLRIWLIRGNWGKVPIPRKGTKRIILRILQKNGRLQFQDWDIEGPDGRKGDNDAACTAVGKPGENNRWVLRMHAAKKMTFNNVNITFGKGGDGGDALALDCCPGIATGGKGGDANNKFRFTAGEEINIQGALNLNPGPGGNGGGAIATGSDGGAGCPGGDGCDATATGGEAGKVPSWGVKVRGNVLGTGNINLGVAQGGTGGTADATGGKGGNGDPCCDGGNGGNATATGGKGGDAKYIDTGAGVGGGGATGGAGGAAVASGGYGGNGGDCYKAPAGDGGAGGDANATGGAGGAATGGGSLTQGQQGQAEAYGGDGGDGGDGCPPGGGGAGGAAVVDGNPPISEPGVSGAPGTEWPVGCQVTWCILIPSICPPAPGPIPDAFSGLAPLIDMGTNQPVGTVPFVWHIPAPATGCVSWGLDPNTNEPTIDFFNNSNANTDVEFDFSNVSLDPGPYGGLIGAELELRQNTPLLPSTGNPRLRVLDSGHNEQFAGNFPPVTYDDMAPPTEAPYSFPDSFFDVFVQLQVPSQWHTKIIEIYIVDP